MIALRYKRPLLQNGRCIAEGYETEWVEDLLREAAREAGVTLPCAREVAQGVIMYLDEYCPLHTLPLGYFFARLRGLLREIGLPLIADHLREQTPPVDIELDTLADEEPLPLFFYTKLRARMDDLRRRGFTTYHFSGARKCSLVLGHRRRACPAQRRVLRELQFFITASVR